MSRTLFAFAIFAGFVSLGGFVGYYICWRQYKERPTNESLRLSNMMYRQATADAKTVVKDCLNGLDLIGSYVASLQLSQPNHDLTQILNAISSLQKTLVERGEDSHLLTPFHNSEEGTPFDEAEPA